MKPNPIIKKAPEKGARMMNILKIRDMLTDKSKCNIVPYVTSQSLDVNVPFPYEETVIMVTEKQMEFLRI